MSRDNDFRRAAITPLHPATADVRGFFESVLGFSGLADRYIRVSSADQRRYFGHKPFGRCAIRVSEQGVLTLTKTKAFGTDSDTSDFIYDYLLGGFRQIFEGSRVIKFPAEAV